MDFKRHRRLRKSTNMRALIQETELSVNDLIYPIFISEKIDNPKEIESMPGIYQQTLDSLPDEIQRVLDVGIKAVLLFGIPSEKDPVGSQAYAKDGVVQKAIRTIKEIASELIVIADTCLCEFTSHGHCGVLSDEGHILNDASLDLLSKAAVSQAEAGADIIAPSNAMDGFVYHTRQALDEAGFDHIPIMSYTVKYASAFYGPFRDAAESTPGCGDRKTYQMPTHNIREALREVESDVAEGADFLMVKPALAYMDVIKEVRQSSHLPLVAYNVSGEYAMVKAAAKNGWLNEDDVVLELLTGLKRAGADLIISYHALELAGRIK